jgi:hypothetical protein
MIPPNRIEASGNDSVLLRGRPGLLGHRYSTGFTNDFIVTVREPQTRRTGERAQLFRRVQGFLERWSSEVKDTDFGFVVAPWRKEPDGLLRIDILVSDFRGLSRKEILALANDSLLDLDVWKYQESLPGAVFVSQRARESGAVLYGGPLFDRRPDYWNVPAKSERGSDHE